MLLMWKLKYGTNAKKYITYGIFINMIGQWSSPSESLGFLEGGTLKKKIPQVP